MRERQGQDRLLYLILLGLVFFNLGLTASIQDLIQTRGAIHNNPNRPSSLTPIAWSPPKNLGIPGRRVGGGAR